MNQIEYSFIRAEKNNDIVVFVKVEKEWLNQDIYVGIDNKKITIKLTDEAIYVSKELEPILIERFNSKSIPIVFTDNEGNFLAEIDLLPKNRKRLNHNAKN